MSLISNVLKDLVKFSSVLNEHRTDPIPNITLQQFNTQIILSRGALYVFILSNSNHDVSQNCQLSRN